MTEIGAIYNDDGKRVARYVPKREFMETTGNLNTSADVQDDLSPAERAAVLERIRAATTGPDGGHLYLSTSCWPHNQHEHCRSATNIDGDTKQPGTCKWGPETCLCECHQDTKGDSA